jgi:uncharacterized membrane protein YjfL (UPF0719 family)
MKVWQFFVVLFGVSVLSIWFTFNHAVEFSAFAVALAKVTIGAFIFYLFDVVALREINTITELKKGNVAVAMFFLGYAILIAACVATA